MNAARWLAGVLACAGVAAHAADAERLPVEFFGKRPFIEDPELSPTGEMIA